MGSKKDNAVFTLRDLARLVDSATDNGERGRAKKEEAKDLRETNYIRLTTSNPGPKYWKYDAKEDSYCGGFLLPNLCTLPSWEKGSAYPRTRAGYRKHIDRMIKKHGPNTKVRVNDNNEAGTDQWSLSEKGDSVCKRTNKGGQVGSSVGEDNLTPGADGFMLGRRPFSDLTGLLKRMGSSDNSSMGSNNQPCKMVDQSGSRVGNSPSGRKTRSRGLSTGDECQQRIPNGVKANVSQYYMGGDAGRVAPQPMTTKTVTTGDKHGVGVHAATQYRGTGRPVGTLESGHKNKTPLTGSARDVASSSSYLPPKQGALGTSYAGGSRAYESDSIWSWGGGSLFDGVKAFKGTSYFNSHSYSGGIGSSFKSLLGLGRGGLAKITSKAEWTTDGSDISTTDKWRSSNPGGAVDELEAKLKSKQLRKHAASIRKHMEEFLTSLDVGAGLNYSPRMSGKKLIKELVSSSYRLSRCQRNEMQTGLKLILVDISPSCAEIRDACYAAALAIADVDKDVVVVCHFNGHTASDYGSTGPGGVAMNCLITGKRQSEIPHLSPEVSDELEKWAATANISGVIAFGDGDAASLYALMAKYMPMVWLFPSNEEYARDMLESYQPKETLDRNAKLWIVSEVTNARTCVEGLRRISKKK